LSLNLTFAHSVDLAFSDHVHCLESFDRPPRSLETEETWSGIDSPFNKPVIRLNIYKQPAFCNRTRFCRYISFSLAVFAQQLQEILAYLLLVSKKRPPVKFD